MVLLWYSQSIPMVVLYCIPRCSYALVCYSSNVSIHSYGIPMVFLCFPFGFPKYSYGFPSAFSGTPLISQFRSYCFLISYDTPLVCLWYSYGSPFVFLSVPMVVLWSSVVCLWFSYGFAGYSDGIPLIFFHSFPMVFLGVPIIFLRFANDPEAHGD